MKKKPAARDPQNPSEWQEAADAAEAALLLHSARLYGLVTGGPGVKVERCLEILRRAEGLGIRPTKDGVDREIQALVANH